MQSVINKFMAFGIFLSVLHGTLLAATIKCSYRDQKLVANNGIEIVLRDIELDLNREQSAGHIRLVSPDRKPVGFYLFVLRFDQDNRGHWLSLPIYNADVESGQTPLYFPNKEWISAHNSYQPYTSNHEEGLTLPFETPIILSECPLDLNLTYASLRYADGTEVTLGSPLNLDLSPIVLRASLINTIPPESIDKSPLQGLIEIDPHGRGVVSQIVGDDRLGEWLKREIEAWSFFPQQERGANRSVQVRFLFAIEDRSLPQRFVSSSDAAYGSNSATWVIRAIPPSTKPPGLPTRWQVYLGGAPVARGKH